MDSMTTTKARILSIDLLRLDCDTQARVAVNNEVVEDYAERIADSNGDWPMGSIDVFHDGCQYYVADGFHRTLAARQVNRESIPCMVHTGTIRDARIYGMTANDKHGLRMSRQDKRLGVEWLLDHCEMTQPEIALKAGVSVRTVKRIVADRKPKKVPMAPSEPETADSGEDWLPNDDETEADSEVVADSTQTVRESTASIVLDSLDREVPKHLRPANELGITLMTVGRELDKYRAKAKELSEMPGGQWIKLQAADDNIRALKAVFQLCRYHTHCPSCGGSGCKGCRDTGFIPQYLEGTVTA